MAINLKKSIDELFTYNDIERNLEQEGFGKVRT